MKLSSYSSPKTEVRKSLIDNKGRFASQLIKKGEVVAIRSGHIINRKELERNAKIINHSEHQITDDLYLAPLTQNEFNTVMLFINHSCSPNIGIKGDIAFIAMRDINPGEELLLEYATAFSDDTSFSCGCGSKNCRKIITGKDWMRKDLQARYGDYFSRYLLQKIKNSQL